MVLCLGPLENLTSQKKPTDLQSMGLRNRGDFLQEDCFFVTTSCQNFLHVFDGDSYYNILVQSLGFVGKKYEAEYLAYVLMPNHLHFIVYFKKENQLSSLMRDFKKFTSGEIRRLVEEDGRLELLEKLKYSVKEQKFKLWQERFDDVSIRSRKVLETKLNYIHENPMQEHWNLVPRPELYPYSSAAFYEFGVQTDLELTHYLEFF
jgi:putative transposase